MFTAIYKFDTIDHNAAMRGLLGFNYREGDRFQSPFDSESQGRSCGVYSNGDKVIFKDFSRNLHWNVIDVCMHKFNIEYGEAKDYLELQYPSSIRKVHTPVIKVKKNFGWDVIEWNEINHSYWKQYGITIETLKHFNVKAVSKAYIEKEGWFHTLSFKGVGYVYLFPDNTQKFLFPEDVFKWLTNSTYLQGIEQVRSRYSTICITKSYKDVMCLKQHLNLTAVAPQGEWGRISTDTIKDLRSKCDRLIYLGDNDIPGLEVCKHYAKLGIESFHYTVNSHKDFSDFCKADLVSAIQQTKQLLSL